MPDFKLGCLPSPEGYPRVFMSRYMAVGLPTPPVEADFQSKIAKWPMMLNDTYGDCVIAGQGHQVQVFTSYGLDKEVVLTDKVIQTSYFTQSGGRDSGLNIPESLDYWVKNPLGGVKLSAWASLNPRDQVEMSQAIAWFGGCYYGVNLPGNVMSYFNAGRDWDNTSQPGNRNAGHCIVAVAYNAKGPIIITWGRKVQCSWAWIEKYATEADVLLSPDWISKVVTPGGLDISLLLSDFEALTSKKPPIPVNPPPIDWFV